MRTLVRFGGLGRAVAAACLLALGAAAPALAQRTTANIRGKVTDAAGAPVAGASIAATNTSSGARLTTASHTDGGFVLAGLQPGTYDIRIAAMGNAPVSRSLQVLVGQDLTANFQLSAQAVQLQGITAVGSRAAETRTSEVATNITREEIATLPQQNRNILDLVGLAPGIQTSPPGNEYVEVSANGLPSQNINVFVDGASLKSDVLPGGVAGQNVSHGNPFPQSAVQELRVITQNFKAEYQQASSAIVTAVTRSGGNTWSGNAFVFGQPNSFVKANTFQVSSCQNAIKAGLACDPTANYNHWQGGVSLGGPIIRDRLHFFGSYEGNFEDRTAVVTPGQVPAGATGLTQAQVNAFAGPHVSPFRENLIFGKLSWNPGTNQTVELSTNLRREHEDRVFGGIGTGVNVSYQSAEHFVDNSDQVLLRHQITRGDWLNQAQVNYQRFSWNPNPLNADQPGMVYNNIIRLGGSSTYQDFTQRRVELRNDLTYSGFHWAGDHVVKGGAYLGLLHYHVVKELYGNPEFTFGYDPANGRDLNVPFQAQIGFGNPDLSTSNTQFGAYLQDDWSPSSRLQLNLGVRWDFETDMRNNDYVTPDSIRAKYSSLLPDNYFSNGRSSRPPFYGEIQPRVGFSYDLQGNGATTLFGGAGIYYDRDVYNDFLDEKFRRQWLTYTIHFYPAGGTPCGGCVAWNPSYLSRQGLIGLIQSGTAAAPDQYFLSNDVKPPKSYQFSAGVRHAFGDVLASATYTGNRGYNGVSYIWGHRNVNPADPNAKPATGTCCQWQYGAIVASDANVRSWYDGLQLQVQRPLARDTRWGGSASLTFSNSRKTGGDLFSFDYPRVADYPVHPTATDQKYVFNLYGTVRLPYQLLFSTILNLGSGYPSMISDCTNGWDQCVLFSEYFRPDKKSFIIPNAFGYRRVDFRAQKDLVVRGSNRIGVQGEVFNAFNYANNSCYDTTIPPAGTVSTTYGNANCGDPARRFQVGITYGF